MSAINAHEEREFAIVDIPNSFIQTNTPKEVVYQKDVMKTRGKWNISWWIFLHKFMEMILHTKTKKKCYV